MQRLLAVHHRRMVSFAVTRNLGNLFDTIANDMSYLFNANMFNLAIRL
ncbi:MAG: hypothetical protein Q4F69_05380 [Bacteroidia bacterium]|nr:hypothetical protein [Bacteroidia bacterium]